MYKFFLNEINNKKGFTLTELLVAVSIMSILLAVAVPIYFASSKKQKINDCENNCQLISTAIQEAMYGMMDNGKKQEYYVKKDIADNTSADYMVFNPEEENLEEENLVCSLNIDDYSNYSKQCVIKFGASHCKKLSEWDSTYPDGNSNEIYGKKVSSSVCCYQLSDTDECFTIGDVRGGYRASAKNPPNIDYNAGCKAGNYLKKYDIRNTPFYKFLANEEIPVCPFDEDGKYCYYIFMDGTVVCGCHKCLEAKAEAGITHKQ